MDGPASGEGREGAAGLVRLRILATTDLHMHILPWDYAQGSVAPDRGLAGIATLVAAARAEAVNSLLVDNGDFLQGSALGDRIAQDAPRSPALHPVIAAMNHMGYDAATLGNHEFSHGLTLLDAALAGARFPVVSTNLQAIDPGNLFGSGALPFVLSRHILDRSVTDEAGRTLRLRIGILGFLPPQTAIWERAVLDGMAEVEDIVTAARRAVPLLRADGADIVLVLSHSGISSEPAAAGMENATVPLAAVAGIDAIVAGHSHLAFPSPRHPEGPGIDVRAGTVAGRPVVMPGAYGSHLGVIDLLLEHDLPAGWRVLSHQSGLRAVATGQNGRPVPPDPAIVAATQAGHQATLDWLARPVGRTDRALGTAFALVAPAPVLRLVAGAKARYVAQRLQGTAHGRLPVLGATAPFRSGGRGGPANYTLIPPGQFCLRHALDLYPHPNTIAALRLTGAEVALWLEHAAGIFRRIRPGGKDQPLVDADYPAFNFDLIDGLDFRIDLSQPARFDTKGQTVDPEARRITDLSWRGAPVAPDDLFIIATNSYRAGGGGGFAGTGPDRTILAEPVPVRDILTEHIATRGTAMPPPSGHWGFVPMPDTTVTFATSPDALPHLSDAGSPAPEALGTDEDGFLIFRLAL